MKSMKQWTERLAPLYSINDFEGFRVFRCKHRFQQTEDQKIQLGHDILIARLRSIWCTLEIICPVLITPQVATAPGSDKSGNYLFPLFSLEDSALILVDSCYANIRSLIILLYSDEWALCIKLQNYYTTLNNIKLFYQLTSQFHTGMFFKQYCDICI